MSSQGHLRVWHTYCPIFPVSRLALGILPHLPLPQQGLLLLKPAIQGLLACLEQMESELLLAEEVEIRPKGFPVTLLTQFYLSIGITHLLATAKVVGFNSSSSPHRRRATGASVCFHTSSQYLLGRFTTGLQLK